MKRIILILSLVTFSSYFSFSQKIEDVGAGVIDFLLRNPKTANKMNSSETVALDIIGDLLKTESDRKHQLEYAAAGRNQITINTNDGRQAQFVKNEQGKIFLLVDGVVYPISQELINQSQGFSNNSIINSFQGTSYDLSEIKSQFDKPKETVQKIYYVSSGGEYLYDIARKLNVSETEINDYSLGDKHYYELSKRFKENTKKLPSNMRLLINTVEYESNILPIFTCKWVKDFNGDGSIAFNEFQQIKKTFYDNENFIIVVPYKSNKSLSGSMQIDIFDGYKGDLIRSEKPDIKPDFFGLEYLSISSNELSIGTYTVNAKILGETISNNTTFEIVQGNSSTREMSNLEKNIRESISSSTPKGIFFYNSWVDLNNDNKYDYNEFTGLNKASYNLKKEVMKIGINYPNKYGEIIFQSWTNDGKLLGTTTNSYQRISGHWAGIGGDPYSSMDFIDMIQIRGKGEYKITVIFVEGGTYEQKLVITE